MLHWIVKWAVAEPLAEAASFAAKKLLVAGNRTTGGGPAVLWLGQPFAVSCPGRHEMGALADAGLCSRREERFPRACN